MKRLYIYMLLFLWGSGVVVPATWYILTGHHAKIWGTPDEYLWQVAKLITVVIALSIVIIVFMPDLRKRTEKSLLGQRLERNTKTNVGVFYVFFLIKLIDNLWNSHKSGLTVFEWTIQGGPSGRLMGYLSIFTDLGVLMAMYLLAYKKNFKIIPFIIVYVFYTVVSGSRSGMMWALVILIGMLFCVENNVLKINLKKYIPYILIGILLMPFLYVVSSSLRGYENYGVEYMINQIVSRVSLLEDGGVALWKADCGSWNESLFYEKYSLVNQFKCIVNSLIPGSVFEQDIWPNLYYRAIFLGESIEQCRSVYCSNFLILPVYLQLKYDKALAVIVSVMLVVGLYILLALFEKYAISRICAIYILLELFEYFDWGFVIDRFRVIVYTFVFTYFIAYPFLKTRFKFDFKPETHIRYKHKFKLRGK